jgi:hypothetical protein
MLDTSLQSVPLRGRESGRFGDRTSTDYHATYTHRRPASNTGRRRVPFYNVPVKFWLGILTASALSAAVKAASPPSTASLGHNQPRYGHCTLPSRASECLPEAKATLRETDGSALARTVTVRREAAPCNATSSLQPDTDMPCAMLHAPGGPET